MFNAVPDDVQQMAANVVAEMAAETNLRCVVRPCALDGALAEVEHRTVTFTAQSNAGGILPAATPRLAALEAVTYDAKMGQEWPCSTSSS